MITKDTLKSKAEESAYRWNGKSPCDMCSERPTCERECGRLQDYRKDFEVMVKEFEDFHKRMGG